MAHDVSAEEFKEAMASFTAGVTLVTTIDESGVPFGLTATAFSSVCKDPPTCLICVGRAAEAHPIIERTARFAVNILSQDQRDLSARFAISGADKFAGQAWQPGPATGCPIFPRALAIIECDVAAAHPAGDHHVFLGLLKSVRVTPGAPLVYFRGHYGALAVSD